MGRALALAAFALLLATPCDSSAHKAVTLTWHAATTPPGAPPVTGYNVYRSVHGANAFALLNPAGLQGLAFVDTSVARKTSYDYYETAENVIGESRPSNRYTVAIP